MVSVLRSDKTTDQYYISTSQDIHDSIASLEWSFQNVSLLACSSWDKNISIFLVDYQSQPYSATPILSIEKKFLTSTEHPCVALSWSNQTSGDPWLLAGSIDGTLYKINHVQNTCTPIGKHNEAINQIFWLGDNKAISISLDKECRIWDLQTNTSIKSFCLPTHVSCADFRFPYLALALNNKQTCVLDINDLWTRTNYDRDSGIFFYSPFGEESYISSVSISKESDIVTFGSLDGRGNICEIKRWNEVNCLVTYLTFRAHILEPGVGGNMTGKKIMFPIHAVDVHPQNKDTMMTAGGDGEIHFWDIQKKIKIKSISWFGIPITKSKISPDGRFLAYGLGYDWSKGIEGAQSFKNQLCIHRIQPYELAKATNPRSNNLF